MDREKLVKIVLESEEDLDLGGGYKNVARKRYP